MESEKVKVLFMRHGNSMRNNFKSITPYVKHKWDLEFIDCPLHLQGEEESKSASKIINAQSKLKYVIVSPLIRARQTAMLVTSTYPEMLETYIHPLLRELESSSSCIPSEFKMLPSEKASLEYFPESNDKYYYIRGLKYESEMLKKYTGHPMKEFEKGLALKMSELYPVYFETREEFAKRVDNFMEFLKDFIKIHKVANGEILVVTHKQFISTAMGYDLKYEDIKNCSITEFDILKNK